MAKGLGPSPGCGVKVIDGIVVDAGSKATGSRENQGSTSVPTQIITANRLVDGAVVYQTADGTWSTNIDDSETLDEGDAAKAALTRAEEAEVACEVIAPYSIDVRVHGRRITPKRFREEIRAFGPTDDIDDE